MIIVMGATGHVGSAVARVLLARSKRVGVVVRDTARAEPLRRLGAEVLEADVNDVAGLRAAFAQGRRAFLLNPPADPKTDKDAEENRTADCILAALAGSGLEAVVAESTYGARPGADWGDLGVLHRFEEGLRAQDVPAAIVRGAYYFSNWDALLEPARRDGVLPTMFPADLAIPMVSPEDLGRVAATLLGGVIDATEVHHVEGPRRLSSADVARTFASVLGRDVRPQVVPRESWEDAFRQQGFSDVAAHSYARMTGLAVDGNVALSDAPIRGVVTIEEHVRALVEGAQHD